MNKEINLVPTKTSSYVKQRKIIAYLRLCSFILLGGIFITSILIFFIGRQYASAPLEQEENEILSKLSVVNNRRVKLAIAKERLSTIRLLLKKRVHHYDTIDEITKLIPQDIRIDSVTVNSKSFAMSVSSSSLLSTEILLNRFVEQIASKKLFKTFIIDGISIRPGTTHTLSMRGELL